MVICICYKMKGFDNLNTYKPQEFAEMIGVSVKTLQRWDNDGKLKAYRTPTDRRYYTHKQYVVMVILSMVKQLFIQESQQTNKKMIK